MNRDGYLGRDSHLIKLEEQVVDLADAAAFGSLDRDDAGIDRTVVDGFEDGPPRRQGHGLRRHEGRKNALFGESPALALERNLGRALCRRGSCLGTPPLS